MILVLGFPGDGPAAPGGFRGFFGSAGPPLPGEEGDFEDGDFGPDLVVLKVV